MYILITVRITSYSISTIKGYENWYSNTTFTKESLKNKKYLTAVKIESTLKL